MKAINRFDDPVLGAWLGEFKRPSTRDTYFSALRKFKKVMGVSSLDEYVKGGPDASGDLRRFLESLEGKPSKTVSTYAGAVKIFLQDHGVKVSQEDWRKIRRRGFMPKRVKAETRDKKPSIKDVKHILNYADIKCRSMVLFLLSSGARIGETLQLKMEDFNLDADPPEAYIRSEYTKGGVGGRTVYFSYEARDAIKDWLKIKDQTVRRRGGSTYKDERMFPWKSNMARFMWNMACRKAGLAAKDNNTKRRVYHLHSLRKFFRTKIGLDVDVIHALMGHVQYLDEAYLRLEQEREIAKAYLEAMPNVSVYGVEDQRLLQRTEQLEAENQKLKEKIAKLESEATFSPEAKRFFKVFDKTMEDEQIQKRFLKFLESLAEKD